MGKVEKDAATPWLRFAPHDRPRILRSHLFVVLTAVVVASVSIAISVLSIVGISTDEWGLVLLDPLCGIPLVAIFCLTSLTMASQWLVEQTDIRIEEDETGIAVYMLGFWYIIPWQLLRQASIVELDKHPDFRKRRTGGKTYLIQVPGLSFLHRLLGVIRALSYGTRPVPYFLIPSETAHSGALLDRIRQEIDVSMRE